MLSSEMREQEDIAQCDMEAELDCTETATQQVVNSEMTDSFYSSSKQRDSSVALNIFRNVLSEPQ